MFSNPSYKYSQSYDKNSYATLIDTVLNPIYGDVVLVDSDEIVYRIFITIDSLANGDEVRSKRTFEFKVKDSYTGQFLKNLLINKTKKIA